MKSGKKRHPTFPCNSSTEPQALVSSQKRLTLERFDLYITAAMVLLQREVTMARYSMDLRGRGVRAWDASEDADDVAATFAVSRAWVHRLVQRCRETGSIAPRPHTRFRSRVLA